MFNIINHFNKHTELNFSSLSVFVRLFGVTFYVNCYFVFIVSCNMVVSLTQSKRMQEPLLLCFFFVADVTCCAVECIRSSCAFENFGCYRHISTEEKLIMHFSYIVILII